MKLVVFQDVDQNEKVLPSLILISIVLNSGFGLICNHLKRFGPYYNL